MKIPRRKLCAPKAREPLFQGTDDWKLNACPTFTTERDWLYEEGFYLLAKIGVDYVRRHHREQDTLVFPIAYQYRHYVELALKSIIVKGKMLTDTYTKAPHGHQLKGLWKECREIVAALYPNGPVKKLDEIEAEILEIDHYDPAGIAFRYATDRDGDHSLKGVELINLGHLAKRMETVYEFLNGVSMEFGVWLDGKYEGEQLMREMQERYEREMREEFEWDMASYHGEC